MSFNKHLHPECFLKTHVCLSKLMSLGSGRYLASLNRYQVDQFKLSQRGDLIWCSLFHSYSFYSTNVRLYLFSNPSCVFRFS